MGDSQFNAGRLNLSLFNMRFTVSSTALSSKLTALSRVINSKNSLPILGDSLFEGVGNLRFEFERESSVAGFTTTIKETIEIEEERKQKNKGKEETVLTNSLTLQSDSCNAKRGYSQTNYAQEEGNIAQRGRCSPRRAVFGVAWLGRDYEGIRQNEDHVLGHSRLARHRRRSDVLYCREEATCSSGRYRAATTDGPSYDDGVGQWHRRQTGGSTDRHQFAGTFLFINTNDRRA